MIAIRELAQSQGISLPESKCSAQADHCPSDVATQVSSARLPTSYAQCIAAEGTLQSRAATLHPEGQAATCIPGNTALSRNSVQCNYSKPFTARGRAGLLSAAPLQPQVAPQVRPPSVRRTVSEERILPQRHNDCSPPRVILRPQGVCITRAGSTTNVSAARLGLLTPQPSWCTPVAYSSVSPCTAPPAELSARLRHDMHSSISPPPTTRSRMQATDRHEARGLLSTDRTFPAVRSSVSPPPELSSRTFDIDRHDLHRGLPTDRRPPLMRSSPSLLPCPVVRQSSVPKAFRSSGAISPFKIERMSSGSMPKPGGVYCHVSRAEQSKMANPTAAPCDDKPAVQEEAQ